MQRKLIQLSPSTSVVSLPSSWIKFNKLKKGNPVSLEIKENEVVISSQQNKKEKEVQIDVSQLQGKLLWVSIDTAYTTGYDSILIKTKDVEQSAYLGKVVRFFPGMMIIDERKNLVHFKSIEESAMEFEKILTRIFNLNISLLEDSLEEIKNKNWESLLKVKYRDYVINSYISYASRSINKYGYSPFSKMCTIHTLLKVMEILADKFCALFEVIGKEKAHHIDQHSLSVLIKLYQELRALHFSYSLEKVIGFEEQRGKLKKIMEKSPNYALATLKDIEDLFFALEELEMQLHS
jgi:phosphate uptake regulator